jgi:hypothetical protein
VDHQVRRRVERAVGSLHPNLRRSEPHSVSLSGSPRTTGRSMSQNSQRHVGPSSAWRPSRCSTGTGRACAWSRSFIRRWAYLRPRSDQPSGAGVAPGPTETRPAHPRPVGGHNRSIDTPFHLAAELALPWETFGADTCDHMHLMQRQASRHLVSISSRTS